MKKSRENVSKEYCNDDPDYAVWVPPTGNCKNVEMAEFKRDFYEH